MTSELGTDTIYTFSGFAGVFPSSTAETLLTYCAGTLLTSKAGILSTFNSMFLSSLICCLWEGAPSSIA
jgi:hypothetical protein